MRTDVPIPGNVVRALTQWRFPVAEKPYDVTIDIRLRAAEKHTPPRVTNILVGENVASAQLLPNEHMMPVYPKEAKKRGIEGTVRFLASIGKVGAIRNAAMISGPFLFYEAASRELRIWRYEPFELNGQPTEVETSITVNCKLSR